MDFETYWTLFSPDCQFENRRDAAEQEWYKHPDKQGAIIAWLETHGCYKGRNPYFFILDFKPQQMQMSYADYYAKFGTENGKEGLHEHKRAYRNTAEQCTPCFGFYLPCYCVIQDWSTRFKNI